MDRAGKVGEDLVVTYFRDRGYTVLNTAEAGFPDLIVVKDGRIEFFAEVKSGKTSIIGMSLEGKKGQRFYHQKLLEETGITTKAVRVVDGEVKIEEERTTDILPNEWTHKA